MRKFTKNVILWRVLAVVLFLVGLPTFSGFFVQAEEEVQTVLQDRILYTLYPDGTAEVTQVGEGQKPLPWSNQYGYGGYEEGDEYEFIHERFDVSMGDITIPETVLGRKSIYGYFDWSKGVCRTISLWKNFSTRNDCVHWRLCVLSTEDRKNFSAGFCDRNGNRGI